MYQGHHQENTWQITYTGAWEDIPNSEAVLGAYRRAEAAGASLSLHWEGRVMTLVPGPGEGVLSVAEDGGAAMEIPLRGKPVTLSRHWARGCHSLTLTATGGDVTLDELRIH